MELRKEYADIVERERNNWLTGKKVDSCAHAIALACQELADRPPKELTDAEIESIHRDWLLNEGFKRDNGAVTYGRAIIAAFLAKRREPETEPLSLRLLKTGEWYLYLDGFITDVVNTTIWRTNPMRYTMRKKPCAAEAVVEQRESATVKFRAARLKTIGDIHMLRLGDGRNLGDDWEWLDADGKAQEFEVKA